MKILIPFALALGGCAAARGGGADELIAADRAFADDTRVRRLEAWVDAFDEHGSQVDGDFAPVTGHAAIRAHMGPLFEDPANELVWAPDDAWISEGGKLGATTGRFELKRARDDGTREVLMTGRYFDVWRKRPDGSWKLLYDVGDPDPGR